MKNKLFLLTLLLVALISSVSAQTDVIVTTDAKKIDAKILEVSKAEIKYKRVDNLEGPTFVLSTDEINTIIFSNGQVETYTHSNSESSNNSHSTSQTQVSSPSNPNGNTTTETSTVSKLKFNPQPSDNFIVSITVGYVSKTLKAKNGFSGSLLYGNQNSVSPALRVGLTINPTFKYGLGIRTGAYLEYAREKGDISLYDIESRYIREYNYAMHDITISLPVQLSYRYELIPKFSFMIYTGPVFDLGALRKMESRSWASSDYNAEDYSRVNLYNYRDQGYTGFNVLWGVGGAIQWSHLRLDVGGEFGLLNKSSYESAVMWNKPVYVTLSYFF